MKRFKVAHVITRLCKGGAQENTFHTVRLANRERYDVHLISGPTFGDEGSIEDDIRRSGLVIHREPDLIRKISPVHDLRALNSLTRRFRDQRYDIVHTHTSKAGVLGRLAARRAGVPIVVHTAHGNIFDGYFAAPVTAVFTRIERRAARWADRLIELTDGGIEEHLNRRIGRREQYTTIFSGIDLGLFEKARENRAETRRSLNIPEPAFAVGGVGRLEPIKGFPYFIAAAELVARTVPNAHFVLAGTGSQERALRDQAGPLGERFRFLGMRNDIANVMAALDLLVVPSLNEGMGRVILEAGAAGIPVVASKVGGIPDVVDDAKTGVLVPPKNAEAIAEVVGALAADPDRISRMGNAARNKIVPEYGLEQMVRKIEALYEALIREKNLDAG